MSANLRRLRAGAGLTQQALAEASGISRRMIVKLEQGDTNISLATLDRLAEALGTTFVAMVSDPVTAMQRLGAVAWRGTRPESVGVLLGTVSARREAQLWSWALSAGERYQAEPDPQGWHEMVFVYEGRLRLVLEAETHDVAAGDYRIYSSAQRYAYVNDGPGVTRFVRNVVD